MPGIRLFLIKQMLLNFKQKARYHNIRAARIGFEKAVAPFNRPLRGFSYETIEVSGMKSEWISGKSTNPHKVILYFHGGGYAAGGIETHRAFCSQLVKYSGAKLLLIEYRLAPENTYPAPIEDAVRAYQWLLAHHYRPEDICFAGDSAGGGIAIGTLAYLRDHQLPLPACAVTFSPWLDHTFSGKSYVEKRDIDPMLIYDAIVFWSKAYLGNAPADAPYVSPILHPLDRLPPLFIQVGSDEMLLDDSLQLAQKAKASGVDVTLQIFDGYFHVFNAFWKILPGARKANQQAGFFIARHLGMEVSSPPVSLFSFSH
jgi:acetyl esterase/lipase